MTVVRREERPVLSRGPGLPTLQHLVDRANGSEAVTVLVNRFTDGEAVPAHTHDVEEVLVVTEGECVMAVEGREHLARAGDAVIVKPGAVHSLVHRSDQACTVVAVLGSPDATVWSE
jgi:quercetin dioxygenase-like cupin family protein